MGLEFILELFLRFNSCEAVYGGPDPLLLQTGHRLQVFVAFLLTSVASLVFCGILRIFIWIGKFGRLEMEYSPVTLSLCRYLTGCLQPETILVIKFTG
jgi:hypothetical protein